MGATGFYKINFIDVVVSGGDLTPGRNLDARGPLPGREL